MQYSTAYPYKMTHFTCFQEAAVIQIAETWFRGGQIRELGRSIQPDDQVKFCGTVC